MVILWLRASIGIVWASNLTGVTLSSSSSILSLEKLMYNNLDLLNGL